MILFKFLITLILYFLSIGNCLIVDVENLDRKLNYDYIVVGSGSAGSIIAERLALSGSTVLVIEAGAESSGFFNGPDIVTTKGTLDSSNTYTANRKLTKYDVPLYWSSAYLNLKKWHIPGATVAKTMGGCGVHNGLVFQRAREQDYDDWNIPGWRYIDMFPYMKKLYTILDPELQQNGLHGHSGRIQVGKKPYDNEGSVFLESCKTAGLPFNSDFQNDTRDGCGYFQFNINSQGERSSSLHEYLQPASQRSNVDILINAQVTNVIIDRELSGSYFARGVRYFISNIDEPSIKSVFAKKEVILCAGSLNTPKILMHSGIGDRTYLSAFQARIPKVYSSLPGVGKNLQNHHLFFMIYQYSQCSISRFPLYNQDLSYSTTGTGIFSTPGYSVGAWLRGNSSIAESENIMLLFPGTIGSTTPFPSVTVGISVGYPEPNEHYVELNPMGIGPSLLDFYRLPQKVNYTPSRKPEDIEKGLRGLKEAHRIMTSPPISLVSNVVQPSSVDDDDFLREFIKNSTFGHDHWVGTCKMGLKTDPMAVVDERLRVIGIKKLRVVDGSILPKIPFGLVHATIMAIAEKASDLIIQDNK